MTRPSEVAAAETQRTVLRETLLLAVPLHMVELHGRDPETLAAISTNSASVVASKGDTLQFKGGKRGEAAEVFNALARGLAAAALTAEGGIDFLGLHWCAVPNCRAESRFDHAEPGGELQPPDQPAARAIHTLPDLSTWPPPAA